MLRLKRMLWLSIFAFVFSSFAANAEILVSINKYSQTMRVYVDGYLQHSWLVSTGKWGHDTPTGTFTPTLLDEWHRSGRYGGAVMPYSIFFYKGYAIHGSYEVERLGEPASHGCIRLEPENAADLYYLVRNYGQGNTQIVIRE